MRLPSLILILLLTAFAPFSRGEEKQYGMLLGEPVPPTVIPMGRTEKDLTPIMREALAALEVAKQHNHLCARYGWIDHKYPKNPIYKEKSLHEFWIKERTLTPDEAAFAYACLGIAAEDQILTRERVAKRGERTDIDMGSIMGSSAFGYTLTLACDPLKVRYSREKQEQTAEMERVTAAALDAAVRRHRALRALRAAREPDFRKKYILDDETEAHAARAKFPPPTNTGAGGPDYTEEAMRAYIRVRSTKFALFERARRLEELYERHECQELARVFLQWVPGDKDRIRKCLTEAGYATPEARAQFWKIAGAKTDYYFNEEHLARLYDPKTP